MNILIKLMSIVSLVIAPTLAQMGGQQDTDTVKRIEIKSEHVNKVAENSNTTYRVN
jgi:K(+)-stimulated pyrophosphate-energized sodium pump